MLRRHCRALRAKLAPLIAAALRTAVRMRRGLGWPLGTTHTCDTFYAFDGDSATQLVGHTLLPESELVRLAEKLDNLRAVVHFNKLKFLMAKIKNSKIN